MSRGLMGLGVAKLVVSSTSCDRCGQNRGSFFFFQIYFVPLFIPWKGFVVKTRFLFEKLRIVRRNGRLFYGNPSLYRNVWYLLSDWRRDAKAENFHNSFFENIWDDGLKMEPRLEKASFDFSAFSIGFYLTRNLDYFWYRTPKTLLFFVGGKFQKCQIVMAKVSIPIRSYRYLTRILSILD